jgi:hypothetical protein
VSLAIIAGHVVERPSRELTDADAHRITTALAAQGIHIAPVVDVYRTVHLWAQQPVSTTDEVRALRAYSDVTDSRLALHEAAGHA